MSDCRSCGAAIRWAISKATGKWIPIDPTPTLDGNLALEPGANADEARAYTPEDAALHRPRYTSHFATCPDAAEHRRAPTPRSSGGRHCTPINLGGGVTGFVCGGRGAAAKPCSELGCGAPSVALCDYPLAGKKTGKTCSKPVCEKHRRQQGAATPRPGLSVATIGEDTIDYCPTHDRISKAQGKLL